MEDIEEQIDDELEDEAEEPQEVDPDATAPAPAGEGEDVESIEDLLVKKEAREEEEEEESVLNLSREERLEPLAVKVVPPQPTEFICKNCYLVKHRSQLKDKARMLCRDCA
ncbi:MAG TPA: DUF4193 family protein [Actinomycetota bacterium]